MTNDRIFEHMLKSNSRDRNEKLEEFKARFGDTEERDQVISWRASYYSKGKDGNFSGSALPEWIYGKEVRVFKMPEVDSKVVAHAISGIEELVEDIGLDFEVNYYGSPYSAVEQVREATQEDGDLDANKLLETVASESQRKTRNGRKSYANVFITNQFWDTKNDEFNHMGYGKFDKGSIILFLPKEAGRQEPENYPCIRKIAKHEAAHLFGYQKHHDKVHGDHGYEPVPDCNMLDKASVKSNTTNICEKCTDAIDYFWKGIEDRTGKRFLKKR